MSFRRLKSDFSFQRLPQLLDLTLTKYSTTHFATYTIKEVEMQAKLSIKDNTQNSHGSHTHVCRLVQPLKNIWCSVNRMVLVKSATTSRVRNHYLGTAHRATLQATPLLSKATVTCSERTAFSTERQAEWIRTATTNPSDKGHWTCISGNDFWSLPTWAGIQQWPRGEWLRIPLPILRHRLLETSNVKLCSQKYFQKSKILFNL